MSTSTDRTDAPVTDNAGKSPEQLDRLRRRAAFLRELEEAKALRDRIAPRRAKVRQIRAAMRRATYHH
ncbi:hypothetical protein BWI15_30675 [Kribbella sp. ALI-6-A]|nr:hypothetical protein BWI15_30675 [Kribbella sp. ALI-6-A]